jgi:hypothetical protein
MVLGKDREIYVTFQPKAKNKPGKLYAGNGKPKSLGSLPILVLK